MKNYIKVMKQYLNFKGRASRKEFWTFTLFHFIFIVLGITAFACIRTMLVNYGFFGWVTDIPILGIFLVFIYCLAAIPPALGVTVRRLHDLGKSGSWLLCILVPFIGWLILFVLMMLDSQEGENEYDKDTKETTVTARTVKIGNYLGFTTIVVVSIIFFITTMGLYPQKYGHRSHRYIVFGELDIVKSNETNKWGVINEICKEIIPCKYEEIEEIYGSNLKVKLNEKYGILDKTGKEIIPCKYDEIQHNHYDGELTVKLNDKYGFIDKSRNIIISCQYEEISEFSQGKLFKIKLNSKYGLIDESENIIIPAKYDKINNYDDGTIKVALNGKYGIVDKKTWEEIIPCKYEEIEEIYGSNLKVKLNEKYGILDKTGKEIIPCQYEEISKFFNGNLLRVKLNNKYGLIDKNGNIIIPAKYDALSEYSNERILARLNNESESFIINTQGNMLNLKVGSIEIANYNRNANTFDIVDAHTARKLIYNEIVINGLKMREKYCEMKDGKEMITFKTWSHAETKTNPQGYNGTTGQVLESTTYHNIQTFSYSIGSALNYELENGTLTIIGTKNASR